MANNPLWANAAVNAVTGNAEVTLDSGTIEVYSGAQPALNAAPAGTLLVTMTFGATAFGAADDGVATANAVTSGTAMATGTAECFALYASGGTLVMTGTAGATSGFDLNLNSASIVEDATVSCSAFTITG